MPETKSLFNRVAEHYDLLNTIFSLGMDRSWRKRLAEEVRNSRFVLDIATGTAEVAIEVMNRCNGCYVIGLDPSEEMLELGRKKLKSLGINGEIALVKGVAENLPFEDGSFDAITIAFGIRNTVDPLKSLEEMKRVLKPGGIAGILEFAVPQNKLFGSFYMFYLQNILPFIGSLFGRKEEYKYLGDSTSKFPQRDSFTSLMKQARFKVEKPVELTMGTVILYIGVKDL
ncbi:MAG TPA: bifunctional demethylmenaquinone methyltransferase/2-methoxy-6-polyprenyl-1,4-benzoquinol methylase UbiE [Thermodesulfobacteriota bacterium]|nr:bifunctional demethylmenaquinone methyltransferase/2-methoxy-6-polyprenyl-1,4-benzoquinol methylase UbiE [Thermodesulfobacteriota bacterium]